SATVHQADVFLLEGIRGKRIVIKIEAARETPTPVENKGANHGPGGITCVLEGLGHGAKLLSQRLPGEILHAVLKGVSAGQDHRVRRPGKWNLRDGSLKQNPVVSQRIEGWSLDHRCSVTSHVIGTHGIDGDQYNAGFRNRFRTTGSRSARHGIAGR